MLDMFQKSEYCHVCNAKIKVKKNESPSVCQVCGADLANPAAETVRDSVECEHIKGFFGIAPGELYLTTRRLFWVNKVKTPEGGEGYNSTDSVLKLAAMAKGKGEGEMKVNVPLDNIGKVEECRKGLRRGVTVHTKSGESYNFFFPNLGNPQKLKDLLAPYIK